MDGLMMDMQLTLPMIARRAETFFHRKEVVSRLPDRSYHRYSYADMARRSRQLAAALQKLGVNPGDRVGTICWNHHQHLEAYFGIPWMGAVLHTINPRLNPPDIVYIVNHAQDRVLLVDEALLPLAQALRPQTQIEHLICVSERMEAPEDTLSYEALLAESSPEDFVEPELDERQAAAMCYTSGTTGRPKGVLYSHRSMMLHTIGAGMGAPMAFMETDVVCPVVPMFHVNAWGMPYTAAMVGANLVFPGPYLDPVSLAELFEHEHVTVTAGVPTLWLGLLQLLDRQPGAYDLSSIRAIISGGQALPAAAMQAFHDRFNIDIEQAWGMTETSPIGTANGVPSWAKDASREEQLRYLNTGGRPTPLVEIRARGDEGFVPWDGASMGELEIRGPWIASAYYENPEGASRFSDDGWLKTGDIVTIDPDGFVQITDRAKDIIKSGGEWISSVDLENAAVGCPGVAEAAAIGIAHPRWDERPLLIVVRKVGSDVTAEAVRAHLAGEVAKWWLPDEIVFVDSLPH
ncbi:MAG TPA: long-chain fatty acid--CoA ligase, partial [Thermomicrobiaceae bacterium]|nr:long-chain fatty acid--CoA ligase [Thermomicrobiaceae bacterium]